MNLLSLYVKGMDPGTCAWVSVFVYASVCESECREDAVHSLAYARVRVSFSKDVGAYPSVLFLCVPLLLSGAGAPQLGALPPPFPVSRPPGGLNLVTHRGGGSGSGFSPGPTHLEPVATPPSHQDSGGESPFTAPGRGEFP